MFRLTVVGQSGRLVPRTIGGVCMRSRAAPALVSHAYPAASLQRTCTCDATPRSVPSIVHDVLHSPGLPLDPHTRGFMESRFGHDFSRVRVHTDSLNVPGGGIRNIALRAAFLAADAGEPVRMGHLLYAAQSEYAKLEKPLTEAEVGGWV